MPRDIPLLTVLSQWGVRSWGLTPIPSEGLGGAQHSPVEIRSICAVNSPITVEEDCQSLPMGEDGEIPILAMTAVTLGTERRRGAEIGVL